MGDENPGCSAAGDPSPGHFPCLTRRMPRGELPALQPAQLTCGVCCGRQGACSRPGSEPKAGRTAGSQPWGSPHPPAPEWGGTSRDHRSLMPALIPPRAAPATPNTKPRGTQGSAGGALRGLPQAGPALGHGRGGWWPALRGPWLGGLAVHCRGSYGLCSALRGGWRRQPQHHRVARGVTELSCPWAHSCAQSFPASAHKLLFLPAALRP